MSDWWDWLTTGSNNASSSPLTSIASAALPAAVSSIGGLFQNQATNEQSISNREDSQQFQEAQAAQAFQNQLILEQMRQAASDKGAGAAVAAARIRAQSEKEANIRQAYDTMIAAILRGADLKRQPLSDLGQQVGQLRLPGAR